jgi:pyruvate/2-oxoglutarate dehydrogenase complex dihydrolipoamide acyltransferase (E2) component
VQRPTVHDGQIAVRPMLPLTLTFDHAVIDGAPAARFVETLRELTETAAALASQSPILRDERPTRAPRPEVNM